MSVTIYVEGGGVGHSASLTKCRKGFGSFFERLLPGKNRVKIIPCGGRSSALRDFRLAHESRKPGEYIILLVDSERPVEQDISRWEYVKDGSEKPKSAEDDQAHLMVQSMEAWFMADWEAVITYFGEGLKIGHSPEPAKVDIEKISKAKITAALDKVARKFHKARGTKKQRYDKVQDGFTLLEVIDPNKVCYASNHARRLKEVLERKLQARL